MAPLPTDAVAYLVMVVIQVLFLLQIVFWVWCGFVLGCVYGGERRRGRDVRDHSKEV